MINDSAPAILDIKEDFVFKQVFGIEKNKNVLMSFLNAVLRGTPKIVDLELLNTDAPKLVKDGKGIRLDVKAKVSDDTFCDIEIQCRNSNDLPERAIQYLARMLNENAKKKDAETQDYHYPKVIGIWILGQNATKRKSAISEASMVFHKNDRDDYQIMSDKARVLFIELNKFKPNTIDKKNMLDLWLSFLKDPEARELKHVDKTVDQAIETLKFISADKEMREIYIAREETKRDHDSEVINTARVAREEGREEGIAEERKKNAVIIAERFGISIEEAEKLLSKDED